MRQLNAIEYHHIAGGSQMQKWLETCTKTPTSESAEEQLNACQQITNSLNENINVMNTAIASLDEFNKNLYAKIDLLEQTKQIANFTYDYAYDDEL
jgi:hypothetical protein